VAGGREQSPEFQNVRARLAGLAAPKPEPGDEIRLESFEDVIGDGDEPAEVVSAERRSTTSSRRRIPAPPGRILVLDPDPVLEPEPEPEPAPPRGPTAEAGAASPQEEDLVPLARSGELAVEHLHHFGLADDPFRSDAADKFDVELPSQQDALARLDRGVRQGAGSSCCPARSAPARRASRAACTTGSRRSSSRPR
jgi:hypothetical protein